MKPSATRFNNNRTPFPLDNERGVALITVMVMLLLLMILGATLLTSSTTELRIVGNYRNTEEAFYAADALVETLYTGILPDGSDIRDKVKPGGGAVTGKHPQMQATYSITYSKPGNTRTLAGQGYDDTFTDATSVYVADVIGSGVNNATVELETSFALIEP